MHNATFYNHLIIFPLHFKTKHTFTYHTNRHVHKRLKSVGSSSKGFTPFTSRIRPPIVITYASTMQGQRNPYATKQKATPKLNMEKKMARTDNDADRVGNERICGEACLPHRNESPEYSDSPRHHNSPHLDRKNLRFLYQLTNLRRAVNVKYIILKTL